jgi:hypothetical protein
MTFPKPGKTFIAATAAIILAKLAFYVYIATVSPESFYNDDTPSYLDTVYSLINESRFYAYGKPEILRTPGYPLFLAPFHYFFGEGKIYYSIIAHIFLSLVTAALIYKSTLLLWDDDKARKPAAIAFFIALLDPAMVVAEFSLLSETVFLLFLTFGIYLLLKFFRTSSGWLLLSATLIISVSAYIRPAALYLNYIILVAAILFAGVKRDKKLAAMAVLCLLTHGGLMSLWEKRNQSMTGERFFTTATAYNLHYMIAASVYAKAQNINFAEAQNLFLEKIPKISDEDSKLFKTKTGEIPPIRMSKLGLDAKVSLDAQRTAIDILLSHPLITTSVVVKGAVANMFEPGTWAFANMLKLRQRGGLVQKFLNTPPAEFAVYVLKNEVPLIILMVIGGAWVLILWMTFAVGIATRFKSAGVGDAIFMVTIAYFIIIAAGPHSLARYRVPAVPFIAVYSALGMAELIERRKLKRQLNKPEFRS